MGNHLPRRVAFCLIVIVFLAGCVTQNIEVPDPKNMSNKDLLAFAMRVYNDQFEYHKLRSAQSDLTIDEKRDLNWLKGLLTETYPIIDSFATIIEGGGVPSPESRQKLIIFVEDFIYKYTEG